MPLRQIEYRGVIENIERDIAYALLYEDSSEQPKLQVSLPKDIFSKFNVPYKIGTVFNLDIKKTGKLEDSILSHVPFRHPTKKELKEDKEKLKRAFGV